MARTLAFALAVLLVWSTPFDLHAGGESRTAEVGSTGRPVQQKFFKHPSRHRRSGHYIVVLIEATHEDLVATIATSLAERHKGRALQHFRSALKGFVAQLSEAEAVSLSEDPRVAFVEEDTVIYASTVQTTPGWGLDRLDQRRQPLDDRYVYDADGRGVHLYVLDSGVWTSHAEFAPAGRATHDWSAYSSDPNYKDCNGHGTHVASLAAGVTTGVARAARVHALQVLGCDGNGFSSTLADALDWVAAHHTKPAVASFSVGGGWSSTVTAAIKGAVAAGVTVVGAAGNSAADACYELSGASPESLTVGNTTDQDRPYVDSNYGSCVDMHAPGTNIRGAWNGTDSNYRFATGTSMSTPFVAGAVALYLQRRPGATPEEVREALLNTASRDVLVGLDAASPNLLVYTRTLGDAIPPTVALTAPAAGATVSGTVLLSASASDNVEMAGVEFYAGGTLIATDTAAPYSVNWVTDTLADGSYSLTAIAVDAGGNTTTSAARTVTVRNHAVRSAFTRIEAESFDAMSGVVKRTSSIGYLDHGDWVKYAAVDFGTGAGSVAINLAVDPAYSGRTIALHLDGTAGPLLGKLTVASTGGWQTYATQTSATTQVSGVRDLYLVFAGGDGVANIDWLQFGTSTASVTRDAFATIEAESYDDMAGVVKKSGYIGYLDAGDWVKFSAINFATGASAVSFRIAVAPSYAGRRITVRLDSLTGPQIGTLTIASTGDWYTYATQTTAVTGATGVHDVYLVFSGGDGAGNLDWVRFTAAAPTGTGELSPAGWTASASAAYTPASRAIDRNSSYKWQNGRSQATSNDRLQVDLGAARTFNRIVLEHTGNANDYPVRYEVAVSDDGVTWSVVQSGSGTPTTTTIKLPARYTKRYVRVTETGTTGAYWFTVNELRIFND